VVSAITDPSLDFLDEEILDRPPGREHRPHDSVHDRVADALADTIEEVAHVAATWHRMLLTRHGVR
jgi:hypothetical protein